MGRIRDSFCPNAVPEHRKNSVVHITFYSMAQQFPNSIDFEPNARISQYEPEPILPHDNHRFSVQ